MLDSIAKVNVEDFFDPSKKGAFVRAVGAAFSTSGYLRLENHGVDFSLIQAYQEQAKSILKAPLEEKLRFQVPASGGLVGYFRAPRADYDGTLKEDLDMWHVMQDDALPFFPRPSFRNVWPERSQMFQQLGNILFQEFYRTTEVILRASAEYLGYSSNHLASRVEGGLTVLRAIRYPATPLQDEQVRFDAHKDASLLTILSGGSAAGLELYQEEEKQWVTVAPQENELVIGVGDLFEAMTQGQFKSALHRVVSRSREERYSCPYFITPRADVPLSILGAKDRENESVYHFLKQRLGLLIPEYEEQLVVRNSPIAYSQTSHRN